MIISQTPGSNTGLNSQNVTTTDTDWHLTVRPDWVQMSFQFFGREQLERLLEIYETLTGDRFTLEPEVLRFMGQRWTNYGQSVLGARLWYDLPGENGSAHGHAVLSMSGSVLGHFTIDVIRLLLLALNAFHPKYTRFDVAIDDYSKRISFGQVYSAIKLGNYARFKKAQIIENHGDEWGGFTIRCGSRSSIRCLRFYDKNAETKGVINSYRWEAELKDEAATKAVNEWLEMPVELSPQYLGSLVIGCVEFVEREDEKNVGRMKLLPWWKEFREAVGSIRHSFQKIPTKIRESKEWINRAVVKSLATIRLVVGGKKFANWLVKEIAKAPERFSASDVARLERWQYEFASMQ